MTFGTLGKADRMSCHYFPVDMQIQNKTTLSIFANHETFGHWVDLHIDLNSPRWNFRWRMYISDYLIS